MRKAYVIFLAIFMVLGVTALVQSLTPSNNVDSIVKDVAVSRGINSSQITNVDQVNFTDFPQEVNIKNIDKTNLALYRVNVSGEKPVYVITASSQLFENTIKKYAQRMFLTYGLPVGITDTQFLNTAAGVQTNLEKGYVMPRDGTITGLTTNLEVMKRENNNPIQIVIYKNGKEVGFRNSFNSDSLGIQSDYDTMSDNIINFNKGDVLSVKVVVPSGTEVKDITTLLEIKTN